MRQVQRPYHRVHHITAQFILKIVQLLNFGFAGLLAPAQRGCTHAVELAGQVELIKLQTLVRVVGHHDCGDAQGTQDAVEGVHVQEYVQSLAEGFVC